MSLSLVLLFTDCGSVAVMWLTKKAFLKYEMTNFKRIFPGSGLVKYHYHPLIIFKLSTDRCMYYDCYLEMYNVWVLLLKLSPTVPQSLVLGGGAGAWLDNTTQNPRSTDQRPTLYEMLPTYLCRQRCWSGNWFL